MSIDTAVPHAESASDGTALTRLWGIAAPFVFPALMLLALFIIPPLLDREANSFSVYNAFQSMAGLGLVALSLGLTMIIGEFDLSVVGTFALGGMLAVKLGEGSPFVGIAIAMVVCAVFGLIQGLLVALLEVNSMAITLGGYLVTLGIAGTIGDNKSQPYGNLDFSARLNQPIAEVLSLRILVSFAAMALIIAVLAATHLGRDMRATGGGRRASRTAGVRVNAIVVGTFAVAAALAALGGALQSYGVATAASNPGLSPLIFAVTAALLGGVALAGGRGTALGIAAGSMGLCFFNQLFTTLATPQYVISLLTGALLVAVTVGTTSTFTRGVRRFRRTHATTSRPTHTGS